MKLKFNLKNIIMKTLYKTTTLFLVAFLLSSISFSQVVVSNKLEKPESQIETKYNRTQIWISGEWKVSNHEYVWEEGYWAEKRPGYIFLPGYWKETQGGWVWVSGSWHSISMEQWNNLYA